VVGGLDLELSIPLLTQHAVDTLSGAKASERYLLPEEARSIRQILGFLAEVVAEQNSAKDELRSSALK
jgi:hypothetical protein